MFANDELFFNRREPMNLQWKKAEEAMQLELADLAHEQELKRVRRNRAEIIAGLLSS
jgi:hypothetical protein